MRIHLSFDPKPRINLGEILGKNLLDRLVKPLQEFTKSVTETNSKVQKFKIYNKTINNLIHENRW